MTTIDGWLEKTLGEVSNITMGQSPDSRFYSEAEIGMPFLQGCAEFTARFPVIKQYCSQPKKIGQKGSILFSVRAPVGRTNIADTDYIIGRGLAAINGTEVVQSYLEHFLSFNENGFRNASQGSTFEAINSSELNNWKITFPSNRDEQTQIATILSTIDKAIEQTEAIIAKQQRIKTGLMQDLLTRGIDEQGNIRSEATHAFKDSPLGRIPVEWEVIRLQELTEKIIDGTHHTPQYVDHGIPFITVKNLTANSGIAFHDINFITPADHKTLYRRADPKTGDVLVTKDGTLGVARIVTPDLPEFSIFVSVAQLRPKGHLCIPELIWAFFDSNMFEPQLGKLSAGTGLRHIHLEHFREFLIATPPKTEQQRIFDLSNKQDQRLKKEQEYHQKLLTLKTGLMQDLLTGKVRVTDLVKKGNSND